jgi:hypothetical protein
MKLIAKGVLMKKSRRFYSYILYIFAGLIIYGCASEAKNKNIDWEHLDYKKLACDDGNSKSILCKVNDDDINAIGKGKR